MANETFKRFLVAHLSHVEPLSREMRLAYWKATITGKKEDFARFAALEVAYNKTYADRRTFEMLRRWRDDSAVEDPLERRQLDLLYREYLRNQIPERLIERIAALASEIANKFNVYRARVDGEDLTGNQVRAALRESTDTAYRRRLWEADKGVGAVVRDQLLTLVGLRNDAARAVGFDDYYTMSLELSEQDPDAILALFDDLADKTSGPYGGMKGEIDSILASRYKVAAEELMPWHYHDPFFQEAPHVYDVDLDQYYRDSDVIELVSRFYGGIGLDVEGILANSDLYEKPGKDQHAYCIDIDRKGDIRILANVRNDENWTGTMLHELGHAVYDSYIDPDLPFFLREHAHIFATEAIAMLFGRLSKDVDWIQSMVGIDDKEKRSAEADARRNQKLSQLVFTRWCQVMVRFERALYAEPDQDLGALWWDLVENYQRLPRPQRRNQPDWAAKIHVVSAPAYYHNYMLGELLASQLDHHIQTRILRAENVRENISGRREVGEYLVDEVFRRGKRDHWDRMIRDATGEPLTPRYFVEQFVDSA